MTRVLVTGVTGFVGKNLVPELNRFGHQVIGATRRSDSDATQISCDVRRVDDMKSGADWRTALRNVSHVVHLAARVHVMTERSSDPVSEFRSANVEVTESLAREAARSGVRRFVFLSTIKVHGEGRETKPYREVDSVAPSGPYAVSKLEAEIALKAISAETGMEVVIIRPPLIYGPGVRGNLQRLFSLVYGGAPLPFGSVKNARSMIAVQNICEVLRHCIETTGAAGQTLLVADREVVSTPDLIRMIASHMRRPLRLVPVPVGILRVASAMMGRAAELQRICGSLTVDIGKSESVLGWSPTLSLEDGMRIAVREYLESVGGTRV